MKKLITMLTMIVLSIVSTSTSAQKLTKDCWNSGKYQLTSINGPANGKIEVTVYDNNVRTLVLEPTRSIDLSSSGSVSFTVLQPIRTSYVYVVARYFIKNPDGSYSVDYFQNASGGLDGSYDASPTASNQCNVLALKYGAISARNDKENTIITFQLESTDDTNEIIFNLIYPNNVEKKYKVILMDKLSINVMWQITINNVTKQYKITKL